MGSSPLRDRGVEYVEVRALDLSPAFADSWHGRGEARRRTGDIEGAIADLERFLETAPPGHSQIEGVRAQLEQLRGG